MDIAVPIYVVDDDAGVRATLQALFRSSGHPLHSFASAREFLEAAPTLPPGCLLLDVRLPDMDGLSVQSRLRARNLNFPMVVISGFGEVPIAVRAMKAGAIDFVEKPFSNDTIFAAVRAAMGRLETAGSAAAPRPASPLARLSRRERQVLEGLLAGCPNKVIASRLGLSPRTVEIHRARLMDKMQAGSLSELVRFALAAGAAADPSPPRPQPEPLGIYP